MINSTVEYYNQNAQNFFDRTISTDMGELYDLFVHQLQEGAHILDLGCGSGRDTKYFQTHRFSVLACDASQEMVTLASHYLDKKVLCLKFEELDFCNSFDGIWANASLLHVAYDDLGGILKKIHKALKKEGVFFASFKHGNKHRVVDGRHFYDMDQQKIEPYLESLFTPLKIVISEDTRSQVAASPLKQWFNILGRKI